MCGVCSRIGICTNLAQEEIVGAVRAHRRHERGAKRMDRRHILRELMRAEGCPIHRRWLVSGDVGALVQEGDGIDAEAIDTTREPKAQHALPENIEGRLMASVFM